MPGMSRELWRKEEIKICTDENLFLILHPVISEQVH